jgi:hypothetical protein
MMKLKELLADPSPANGVGLLVAIVGGGLAVLSVTLISSSRIKALVFASVITIEIGIELLLLSRSKSPPHVSNERAGIEFRWRVRRREEMGRSVTMFRRAVELHTSAQIRHTILTMLALIVIGASCLAWALFGTDSVTADRIAVGVCGGVFLSCGMFMLVGVMMNREVFFRR